MNIKPKTELILSAALKRAQDQGLEKAKLIVRDKKLSVTTSKRLRKNDQLVGRLTGEEIRTGLTLKRWLELVRKLRTILMTSNNIKQPVQMNFLGESEC